MPEAPLHVVTGAFGYSGRYIASRLLDVGSTVDIAIKGDGFVIRPVRRPRYLLDDLLGQVTAGNRHDEVSTGDPVGREVW